MQFSDTTNIENGIIQGQEFWTRLGDGGISGDATLLKQFTGLTNRASDRIMPRVLSLSDTIRFDDPNNSGRPSGRIDLTSGQHTYTVTTDEHSLDILNIVGVMILKSATATEFESLERVYLDDERAHLIMTPNPSSSGTPTKWIERGNTIFLSDVPNYSATKGIRLLFERQQSYFLSTDTTKKPGISLIFHELYVLYPALDYVTVYLKKEWELKAEIRAKIAQIESDLDMMIAKRNPTRGGLRYNVESCE